MSAWLGDWDGDKAGGGTGRGHRAAPVLCPCCPHRCVPTVLITVSLLSPSLCPRCPYHSIPVLPITVPLLSLSLYPCCPYCCVPVVPITISPLSLSLCPHHCVPVPILVSSLSPSLSSPSTSLRPCCPYLCIPAVPITVSPLSPLQYPHCPHHFIPAVPITVSPLFLSQYSHCPTTVSLLPLSLHPQKLSPPLHPHRCVPAVPTVPITISLLFPLLCPRHCVPTVPTTASPLSPSLYPHRPHCRSPIVPITLSLPSPSRHPLCPRLCVPSVPISTSPLSPRWPHAAAGCGRALGSAARCGAGSGGSLCSELTPSPGRGGGREAAAHRPSRPRHTQPHDSRQLGGHLFSTAPVAFVPSPLRRRNAFPHSAPTALSSSPSSPPAESPEIEEKRERERKKKNPQKKTPKKNKRKKVRQRFSLSLFVRSVAWWGCVGERQKCTGAPAPACSSACITCTASCGRAAALQRASSPPASCALETCPCVSVCVQRGVNIYAVANRRHRLAGVLFLGTRCA